MIEQDWAVALDPARLFEAVVGDPDPWQAEALRSEARRAIWVTSRQAGKSETAAVKALHRALFKPGSLCLLLAPAWRQSSELFAKVRRAFTRLGRPAPVENESALRIEFENESRIVSLPGRDPGTVRGYSGVDLLVVDEAAWVSDELFGAISPMTAVSGGQLVALTTPNGCRGWLYDCWTSGGDAWERTLIPAAECPRIDPEFLELERRTMPARRYASEYVCEFVEAQNQLFRESDIAAAFDPTIPPIRIDLEGTPWQRT